MFDRYISYNVKAKFSFRASHAIPFNAILLFWTVNDHNLKGTNDYNKIYNFLNTSFHVMVALG